MRHVVASLRDLTILLLPMLVMLSGAADVSRPGQMPAGVPVALVIAASSAPLMTGLILRMLLRHVDMVLVATCGMLCSISAVSLLRIADISGNTQPFFQSVANRHLAFVVLSFVALAGGAVLSQHAQLVRQYPYLTAAAALALIGSTMLVGTEVNGARLWIVVGSLRLQPAEMARVLLALFIAAYLYDRRHVLATSWHVGAFELPPVPYLTPVGGALLLALAALAIQNDLGMAALTALSAFAVIAASLRSRWSVLAIGAGVAAVIWSAPRLSPHVQARIGSWLDPWQAPMGSGYQFIQAEYALATGGLSGARLIPDVRDVPEVQTDFVLAAVGAQSGAIVSTAVLVLLAVMMLRCARNVLLAGKTFETQVALSLTVLLGLQILLILGGVLRLFPLTGLTVPFVSYGGTSMLVTGLTVGFILGLGARGKRAVFDLDEFVPPNASAYTA